MPQFVAVGEISGSIVETSLRLRRLVSFAIERAAILGSDVGFSDQIYTWPIVQVQDLKCLVL
jgi:hypothetical protein